MRRISNSISIIASKSMLIVATSLKISLTSHLHGQSPLTNRGHKIRMRPSQIKIIIRMNFTWLRFRRFIVVVRTRNGTGVQMVLHQVFKDTFRFGCVTIFTLDNLFTFFNNSSTHCNQVLSVKWMFSIFNFGWIVRYTSHFKHLHCMSRFRWTGNTSWINRQRASFNQIFIFCQPICAHNRILLHFFYMSHTSTVYYWWYRPPYCC